VAEYRAVDSGLPVGLGRRREASGKGRNVGVAELGATEVPVRKPVDAVPFDEAIHP
jgi:hypothetical protein